MVQTSDGSSDDAPRGFTGLFRPGEMPPLFGDTAAMLIVDDNAPSAEILRRILAAEGYDCTIAANASEARARLVERTFAVALVDVIMPGETGLDLVTDMLRENPYLAIIMVTGVTDPSVIELSMQSGAFGYLAKPFRRDQVLLTVADAGRRRCLEIEHDFRADRLEGRRSESDT